MIRNKSDSMQFKRPCLRKYYKKWMKKFSQFRLKCRKFPKAKGPRAPSQKGWKNPWVFSKMLDEFEWTSLEAIGLLSFSSIGFIVVLCLLKKNTY